MDIYKKVSEKEELHIEPKSTWEKPRLFNVEIVLRYDYGLR
jgi:hypothetical protein